MEQAVEQVLGVELDQFLRGNGVGQGGVVRPGVGVDLLFGQPLQQQAAGGVFGGGEADVGVELLGAAHIGAEHFGDVAAFERHDALPGFAFVGLEGDAEYGVFAKQLDQAAAVV